MQLELKHLAAYLPYGLKLISESEHESSEPNIYDLNSIDVGVKMVNFGWGAAKELTEIKPILRPLSDLTKEIEVNGKKIITAHELVKISDGWISDDENFSQWIYNYFNDISKYPKYIHDLLTECLLKNHFDIFNLIPNGLAIDINTLNNQS